LIPKSVANRLAALEAARSVEHKPPSPWPLIMSQLVAFHLGGYKADGHRSPAEHYARATGWASEESPNLSEMTRALHDGDPLYHERHRDALRRLFAARGVDIEGDDREAVGRTTYELYCEAKAGGMPLPEVPGREVAYSAAPPSPGGPPMLRRPTARGLPGTE
jgi:hypothetical protein